MLFGIYGGQARGTIDAKGVAQRLDGLREAIQANAVMCKTAEAYVQDHMLELSEHTPAMKSSATAPTTVLLRRRRSN